MIRESPYRRYDVYEDFFLLLSSVLLGASCLADRSLTICCSPNHSTPS